jgi:accessory colonization factor AcfC
MNVKVITQDVATLRQAFQQRKREYDALRTAGEWAGAVLHAGILVELALKIAICKNMNVTHLPRVYQVHDLDFFALLFRPAECSSEQP